MGDVREILAAQGGAEPARLIALRLHALHADDRDWILSQIEPEARRTIAGLLAELRELGLSPMPELLAGNGKASGDGDADPVAAVDGADPQRIWRHLRDEPEAVRRSLLTAHPWRWLEAPANRQASIQAQDAFRRSEPASPQPTLRVRHAVIAALARQLAADGTPAPVGAPKPRRGLGAQLKDFIRWPR